MRIVTKFSSLYIKFFHATRIAIQLHRRRIVQLYREEEEEEKTNSGRDREGEKECYSFKCVSDASFFSRDS